MSLRRNRLDEGALAELDALDAALRGEKNELSAFAADVRDAAPRPTPAFLAELDARVREGFPPRDDAGAPASTRRPRRRRLLFGAGGLAVAATIAVAVVGLTGGGSTTTSTTGGGSDAAVEAVPPTAAPQADDAERAAGAAVPGGPTTSDTTAGENRTQRSVERSATLDLTVDPGDVQSTADAVVRATDRVGGIVQTSSISVGEGRPGEARFELRVPVDRLDDALAAYSKLGSVASRTQDAQDITSTVVSVEDRLSDARAERRALLRALGRADTPAEVAALRERLRLQRAEIARLEAELRAVRSRADRSTIVLTIRGDADGGGTGPGGDDDDGSWSLGDAARDALRFLEVAAGVLLVVAAGLIPLAAVALAGVAGGRALGRRRRERGLDAT